MAAKTLVLQKRQVTQSRRYDHLYDPTHTLSSDRDHARATVRSSTQADQMVSTRSWYCALCASAKRIAFCWHTHTHTHTHRVCVLCV